ncbi:hypothetical protein P4E94_08185 [Pontiellaceae bacterium B12219]|nr:hypothetical protein [Pontiellaceae bacterium B12219]
MQKNRIFITVICGLGLVSSALGLTTWKGNVSGVWDYAPNWAGGLPDTNATVLLNHDRQTNAYTVVVQSAAVTDKLWLQSFGDVPIHVKVESGGTLHLNTLRMGDKADDRLSSFTIDGGRVIGQAATASITNTSFLVGNNPEGTAALTITNAGSMMLLGSNGLTVASRASSTGRVDVASSDLQIKESMIIAQGAGSFGELILFGTSSVSITGSLHIAKLDNGALSPTGSVRVMGGLLECGTLNVGAEGNGSMTLDDGTVRVLSGGITLGKLNSNGLLIMNGGSLTTIGSPLNIGHTDSSGTLQMNSGSVTVDGSITLGAASRSFGQINLSGGSITANQLAIGVAESSSGECNLLNGELQILGTSDASFQLANGTVLLEKALLQWGNPNVTEAITNMAASGRLSWTNGLAAGTYSTNGYDGRIVNDTATLYWDNLDNGSQFGQSVIWVEQLPEATLYDRWLAEFELSGSSAALLADPDADGLDNLTEYALGGNPTHSNDAAILPYFAVDEYEYVYRRRSDAAVRGLNYYLETSTNLVAGGWTTNGTVTVGISESADGFGHVTNYVFAADLPALFVSLRIRIE